MDPLRPTTPPRVEDDPPSTGIDRLKCSDGRRAAKSEVHLMACWLEQPSYQVLAAGFAAAGVALLTTLRTNRARDTRRATRAQSYLVRTRDPLKGLGVLG